MIRPVEPGDYAVWRVLWNGYNAFYGRSGPTALAEEITELTWGRFLDPAEPMHALVAARDGVMVGLAHYLFHRSTIQVAPTCYLQDLYTQPDARGTGIGQALIEAVYERARAAGSQRVYWQTHESNTTAMALYNRLAERSGFLVYRKML